MTINAVGGASCGALAGDRADESVESPGPATVVLEEPCDVTVEAGWTLAHIDMWMPRS